ncbi:MAG: YdeI/OmpD-associated family protein [Actinomycetota bacterium]|nr:YdeI/OmpD-associated family protein [Actinomycetota bacterium]
MTEPIFFAAPGALRDWLVVHHDSAAELWVGFRKKGSGLPSITWPEAVDQALCFGWIDGVRKGLDASSYVIRFTPRKPRSTWSAVNVARVVQLSDLGLMQPAGLAAYQRRREDQTSRYSYEQAAPALGPEYEQRFRAVPAAWEFFDAQPPSYQRAAIWWVRSAKREPTRERRLATLIAESGQRRRVAHLAGPAAGGSPP